MAIGLGGSKHTLSIKTVKGSKAFLVLRMSGREFLGKLPEYTVEVVGELNMLGTQSEDVDFHDFLGTSATVTMDHDDDARHFNGVIVKMQRGERIGRYDSFTITMRAWPWFAGRNRNFRVFQEKSVKDIVTAVLADYSATDVDWRLLSPAAYPKLDYCVQYDESDFDFVSRLLEGAGIYYFFEHGESKHTLVLIDAMAKHKSKKKDEPITWRNALDHEASITNWISQQEVRSVKAATGDRDYLATTTVIDADKTTTKPPVKKLGKMEVFEFPAEVVQNQAKPDVQPSAAAITQHAKVMLERQWSQQLIASGSTNARDVSVGTTFEFEEPSAGLVGAALGSLLGGASEKMRAGKYLIVGATYGIEYASYEAIKDLKAVRRRHNGFECEVVVVPVDGPPYRPERNTPRPVAHGPETALVVGSSGNEIETDKHGRIKVQFFWDRLGKKDQNSSCWVRVAQGWAGKGFGLWTLPRMGQEVVVSFLGGNPDRPLVTGSVYNDQNPVAYKLPDHATVSGLKTRTSKEGTAATAHELRFDDKKDAEYIWLQAEKDFYRNVKRNAFDMVVENETKKVKLTRKEVIGENWYMDVRKDVMHNFGKDLHVKVAADVFLTGGATYQVKLAKAMAVKTGEDIDIDSGGKLQVKTADALLLKATGDLVAEAANMKLKVTGDLVLEATGSMTLKVGGSTICLGAAGVDIVGTMVKVNSGAAAKPGPTGGAAPKAPTEAKAHPDTEASKDADYDKLFKDPMPAEGGAA